MRKTQIVPSYQGRLKPVAEWNKNKLCWEAIQDGIEKCGYNSIDRLPTHLKPQSEKLPSKIKEKDFKHNAPKPLQELNDFIRYKDAEKRLRAQAKRNKNSTSEEQHIPMMIILILLAITIFSFIYKLTK